MKEDLEGFYESLEIFKGSKFEEQINLKLKEIENWEKESLERKVSDPSSPTSLSISSPSISPSEYAFNPLERTSESEIKFEFSNPSTLQRTSQTTTEVEKEGTESESVHPKPKNFSESDPKNFPTKQIFKKAAPPKTIKLDIPEGYEKYIALESYASEDPKNELSFQIGEILYINPSEYEEADEGWVVGYDPTTKRKGFVPCTFFSKDI